MQALCKDGTMTVSEWIELAVKLDIDGLEWYAGFLEMADEKNWAKFRSQVEGHGKVIPMMCTVWPKKAGTYLRRRHTIGGRQYLCLPAVR